MRRNAALTARDPFGNVGYAQPGRRSRAAQALVASRRKRKRRAAAVRPYPAAAQPYQSI